ncbi:MAG TPA: hypothetical protein VED63_13165 [Acidimicrobiales bacterium]|nr:hypothetical protein [Acidimicrobiales bacterium]
MKKDHRDRALVRIFIEQDPDDPLTYLVTDTPGENSIPVIPTEKAHTLWTYASPSDDGWRMAGSRGRHPSKRRPCYDQGDHRA